MDYYIFSRWAEPDEGDVRHWEFQVAMPSQDEADAYVKRHNEDGETEFRVVAATSEWEARANLQLNTNVI